MKRYAISTGASEFLAKFILLYGGLSILVSTGMTIYILIHPELSGKLFKVMEHNWVFWLFIVAGVAYGIWRKFANPEEFTWLELPAQLFAGAVITAGCFAAFLFFTTGLYDTETWNGHATSAEYLEGWTEIVRCTERSCSGSGENEVCVDVPMVRYDYHPPEWRVYTSNNESVSIASGNYREYIAKFGNEHKEYVFHMNQYSVGDGNKYVTTWNGKIETMIPTAVVHPYVNFLRASHSLAKNEGTAQEYESLLLPYPEIQGGRFGNIEIDRVLVAGGVNIPVQWHATVDRMLDWILAFLGAEKQADIVVYVVNTDDRGFVEALRERWCGGKKNQIIVIVGTTNFPKVDWADVMIFAGNEDLITDLGQAIEKQGEISDPEAFTKTIVASIQKEFSRVPMATLEHLMYHVKLPWWAILAAFLIIAPDLIAMSMILEGNNIRSRQ